MGGDGEVREKLSSAVALLVVLVQFIHLPFVADVNATGKLFLMALLACGGGVALIWLQQRQFRPALTPWLAVCLLLLAASAQRALLPVDAWVGVGVFGAALLLMLICASLARGGADFFEALTRWLLFAGVVAASLGLCQFFHFRLFGPADYQAYTSFGGMIIPYLLPPLPNMRVIGPQGHAVYFGLFQLVVLIAFGYRYLHRPMAFSRPWLRPFRFLPILLVGTTFFLCQSRGVTLALVVVVTFVAVAAARGWYPWAAGEGQRGALAGIGLCLLASWMLFKVLALAPFPSVSVESAAGAEVAHSAVQTLRTETLSGSNVDVRLVLSLTAALIFRDHPWLGVGLDQFKSFMAAYQLRALEILHLEYSSLEYSRWAHNEYLQLLAEGGVGVGLLVLAFLLYIGSNFWKRTVIRRNADPVFFYSHLLLVPFLVEACFSWPLRYGATLTLFVALLGQVVSFLPGREVAPTPGRRRLLMMGAGCGLLLILSLVPQEMLARKFAQKIFSEPAELGAAVVELERLTESPYNEYYALRCFYPALCRRAIAEEDKAAVARLLPLGVRLTDIEGAYWEWYFLSRLYFLQGRFEDALAAVRTAIDRRPDYEPAWQWLHHLNMARVSERTGVPLEVLIRESMDGLEHLNGGNRNH